MPYEADGLTSLSLAIGVTALLLWGAVWAMRRLRPSGARWNARDCTILRSVALGPHQRLVVVRIGARHLVLGVGSAAVSLLCELDEPLGPITPANDKFSRAIRNAAQRWYGG